MSVHLEAVPSAAAIVVVVCCVRRGASDLQLGSDTATGRHELRVRECPVGLRSPARHRLFNCESDIVVFERGINRNASRDVARGYSPVSHYKAVAALRFDDCSLLLLSSTALIHT